MNRKGVIGIVAALLLVMVVTPAAAQQVFIEPQLQQVSPEQQFLVDIYVQDGQMIALGLSINFDPSLVTCTGTQVLDGVIPNNNNAANGVIEFLGLFPSAVDITEKTKVAELSCTVTQNAQGVITFSAPTAVINGQDATVTEGQVQVVTNITPTPTPTTPETNDGPVTVSGLNIDSIELSDEEVDVGQTIEIDAVWGKMEDWTRRIVIIDWYKWQDIEADVRAGNVGELLSDAEIYWTLPEDAGDATYSYTVEDPGYYVVVVYGMDGTIVVDDSLVFHAKSAVAGKPTVSVSVDRSEVVIGDFIKVKASINTDVPVTELKIFVTGADRYYEICKQENVEVTSVKEACNGKDSWWVPIRTDYNDPQHGWYERSTLSLAGDLPTGTYVAKIDVNYNHPEKRAEATAVFSIVEAEINSVTIPEEHVKGTDLKIEGDCNLAKTSEDADNPNVPEGENFAYLVIETLSGDSVIGTYRSYVDTGGKFSFKIDNFGRNLETGYYRAKVYVDANGDASYNAATREYENADDSYTAIFNLVKGVVSVSADKPTVMRGDKVEITISTNFKINTQVRLKIEKEEIEKFTGDKCANLGGAVVGDYCVFTKGVDAAGKAKFEFDVATNAPLSDYRFKAEDTLNLGLTDEIRIEVVKQTLDMDVADKQVVRGGEVIISGTTVADHALCLYASDDRVFILGDDPRVEDFIATEDALDDGLCPTMVKADADGKVDIKLRVYIGAETGTYYLYVVAPANVSSVDRSADAQKMFAISVIDPYIVDIEIPSKIPYNGKVEVTVITEPGYRQEAAVSCKLEGPNFKETVLSSSQPDAEGNVTFTLDLSEHTPRGVPALEPGLYVFTAKLSYSGETVDDKEVLVEIVSQSLDVTVEPDKPVVGDTLKVTITTNRHQSGYDHIWVTLVGTNMREVQQVTLDSNGTGVATFETARFSAGTLKIYVRDTAGTVDIKSERDLARDLYDLDPADPTARLYKADDDLIVVRTIELLETAPTTTTVVTTTTPVQTTTTVATTTTTVATTTQAVTTTTPAQQGGGIPGFEAVFAIAGLLAVAYLLRRK